MAACASGAVMIGTSCSHKESAVVSDTAILEESIFHADNDIAMTVRSLVDAVRVGEKLTPADYDFEGVLTDGQGTPLYTDFDGAPGEWIVKVENDSTASIASRHVGDLMEDDLRTYILGSLNLNNADLVSAYRNPLKEEETIYHYDSGDIDLNFSTVSAVASPDIEGTLMTIRISKAQIPEPLTP